MARVSDLDCPGDWVILQECKGCLGPFVTLPCPVTASVENYHFPIEPGWITAWPFLERFGLLYQTRHQRTRALAEGKGNVMGSGRRKSCKQLGCD